MARRASFFLSKVFLTSLLFPLFSKHIDYPNLKKYFPVETGTQWVIFLATKGALFKANVLNCCVPCIHF
jgi:hypothetical protein